MSTSHDEDPSRHAGELFSAGRHRIFDDTVQRRLRYHLLRLTLAGLTQKDVEDLRELGRRVFEDGDVAEQSTRIRQRADASVLALAIVDIVERADDHDVPRERVMVGALLGAYATVGGTSVFSAVSREDLQAAAVLAAVGGALAASGSPRVFHVIDAVGLEEYLDHRD
ncbi:hypothetical protein ACFVHW_04880 [Streptomyces sp. NPDC127110]|uniref:hypothetical protein n=1 Tax=Streptomyces sp. NPDC127110 TaxID=3345362 RepID=UPI003634E8EC